MENIPIAMTITGTTSGERIRAFARLLPGNRPRTIPGAAVVPGIVDTTAVTVATRKLLKNPVVHCESLSIRSYQWSDQPGGGKVTICDDEKTIGTISSVGTVRKKPVREPIATSRTRRGLRQESLIARSSPAHRPLRIRPRPRR